MNETICRLCLQTISNDNCQIIAETWVKTLKLNLKISKKTVMCVECADCLRVLSKFTPDRIYTGDEALPLSDVQNDVKFDPVKTEEKCNFCTEICRREDLVPLNESKENKFLASMLERCISETNLKITEELLTCGTCLDALQGVSSFILKCLEVEDKISEYIELEGTDDKGQIELKEVQQFMCRPISKLDMESDVVNKLEESNQVQEGGNTILGAEIKLEREMSHPELVLKSEVADIKSEQTNCDSIDIKSEQSDCDGFQEPFIENKIPNDPTHKLVVTSDVRKCKEKIFHCEIHSYTTEHKGHWKRHLLIHKSPSELKMFNCEFCSYVTKYKCDVQRHLLTHKSPSEIVNMFKCDFCPYEAKQKHHLNIHLLIHKRPSEINMFKCEFCSFETKRKYCYKQHLLTHKSPSDRKMFKCELCSYEAKHKSTLNMHLLTHKSPSEQKLFKCVLCSYEAKQKCNLERHFLTHKSCSEIIKMFKCEFCPYEAKHKSNLNVHLLIHKSPSEIKMFKCELCAYQAKLKSSLKMHLLTHKSPSEINMFKCKLCSYATKWKYSIRRHLLIHKDM